MALLQALEEAAGFTHTNRSNWLKITADWILGELSQKRELAEHIRVRHGDTLRRLFKDRPDLKVADVGCGEGWVLEFLLEHGYQGQYTGLDTNPGFIDHLNAKYRDRGSARFAVHDMEQHPWTEQVDVVICSLCLFEMVRVEEAMAHIARMVKPGGYLLIISIQALSQLIAISASEAEMRENFKRYQAYGDRGCYVKHIDTGEGTVPQVYHGILHSAAFYTSLAQQHHLNLFAYEELNLMGSKVPKIYEGLVFSPRPAEQQ